MEFDYKESRIISNGNIRPMRRRRRDDRAAAVGLGLVEILSWMRHWVGVVSSGSVPNLYDIYRYLNWVRVSGYHEVSISNIHK